MTLTWACLSGNWENQGKKGVSGASDKGVEDLEMTERSTTHLHL